MKRHDLDAVLQAIAQYHAEKGYAPTLRELTALCGMSSVSVADYWLDKLERAGRIRRTRGIARSIVVVR